MVYHSKGIISKKSLFGDVRGLSKMVITFVCENRHDVETVTFDLTWRGEVSEEEIRQMITKNCRCRKCGSDKFIYRTRYKK